MAEPNRLAAALSYEQDRPAFGNPSMLEQGRKMRERKQAEQVDRSAQNVKSDLLARALMYRYNPETLTGLTDTPGPQTLDEAAGLDPRVDRSTFLPYSQKEGLHVPAVAADLMKLATASNPQYSNLMQPEEAMPLATNMMGGGVVASRLAPVPAGSLGMNVVAKRAFTAPQDEALRLAQQRAALPVEQGGLGLPADNTPQMRADAMGFDTDVYHGTTNDFNKFAGRHPTYAAEEPRIADIYANATTRHMSLNRPINAGPNIMPLKLGGKEFSVSDLGEGGGGWYSDNLAEALGIPRARGAVNELPNYGIDRLKVTDMGDLGGVQTQHMIPSGSDNIRSRFAAFDPFRRNAALAAALGVAAPDLLAEEK